MVISAPWNSDVEDGALNLRGIAILLSLASFLKSMSSIPYKIVSLLKQPPDYSHWARDIIFVVGDDRLTGMHAWLSAYHREVQPSRMQFCSLEMIGS